VINVRDLPEMFAEIRTVNQDKGWQPHKLTSGEVLALLHSEVSEALEAWREYGFDDITCEAIDPDGPYKPEGVGSELADVLIRWIDNMDMFGLSPDKVPEHGGKFGFSDRPGVVLNVLHDMISRFSIAYDSYLSCPIYSEIKIFQRYYIRIFYYLEQAAENFGIDLMAEYQRKLEYNKTRAYRHGGKLC
jgi:NTP pyrophosphatase (non-canonical NTP hydrolase)